MSRPKFALVELRDNSRDITLTAVTTRTMRLCSIISEYTQGIPMQNWEQNEALVSDV